MSAVRVQIRERTVKDVRIGTHTYSMEEAQQIYADLSVALGKPQFEYAGCGNRYSHGPHLEGTRYCLGHSFDQT
jgi:hypothetical protein